jgi:GAF domain-containing protein
VITVTRTEVAPFSDRQVELPRTFADQAVIATQNVRLFDELHARTHTDAGVIYVLDELDETLRVRATYGLSDELVDAAVRCAPR